MNEHKVEARRRKALALAGIVQAVGGNADTLTPDIIVAAHAVWKIQHPHSTVPSENTIAMVEGILIARAA